MPMFNWSAGPGQTIVLPHFWVYWAFAIPLTFFVLTVWLLFMAWSELRRKRIRPESDPENMNETLPRDKATLEQQETIEQIVHMNSTNTGTILVGGEHKE